MVGLDFVAEACGLAALVLRCLAVVAQPEVAVDLASPGLEPDVVHSVVVDEAWSAFSGHPAFVLLAVVH